MTFIHPMALVTDSEIGEDVKIWQFASVIRGAVIKDGAQIASGALIDGSYIGEGSAIGQSVIMGPGFVIGRECFLGPNVVLCNDTWPRIHKGHFTGYQPATGLSEQELRDQAAIVIKDGVSIGANATILPGVTLGTGCMIAAGAVVSCDVPDRYLYHRDGGITPITSKLEKIRLEGRCKRALRHHAVLEA